MEITKRNALEKLGCTQPQLAKLLGVKYQAVWQWQLDEPLPALRQYQLREKHPELFPTPRRSRRRKNKADQANQ